MMTCICVVCYFHMFADVPDAVQKINDALPAQIRVLGKVALFVLSFVTVHFGKVSFNLLPYTGEIV